MRQQNLEQVLQKAGNAVEMLMIIADGVWWRRAVDPKFDAEAVLPMFFDVTRYMLLDRGKGARKSRERNHEG